MLSEPSAAWEARDPRAFFSGQLENGRDRQQLAQIHRDHSASGGDLMVVRHAEAGLSFRWTQFDRQVGAPELSFLWNRIALLSNRISALTNRISLNRISFLGSSFQCGGAMTGRSRRRSLL